MSFASFLQEKEYLENVSTNALRRYRHALKWLPCENPNEQELKDMVLRMREKGMKATGCNAAIRAINCYLRWSGSPHKVRKLKEPQQIVQTFSAEQVKTLIYLSLYQFAGRAIATNPAEWISVRVIAREYHRIYQEIRAEKAAARISGPLGLTLDTFRAEPTQYAGLSSQRTDKGDNQF